MKNRLLKNPLTPLVAYFDLTLINPVKSAAAVLRRKKVALTKRRRVTAFKAAPQVLMDHSKFRSRQEARLRAREQEVIRRLISEISGREKSSLTAFRPVSHMSAAVRAVQSAPGEEGGRTALYLVKR